MLNYFFDRIYCINLDRRPDRWGESLKEFEKWGIKNFERFPAFDGNHLQRINNKISLPEQGIILSNIGILEDAIKNKYQRILVLEDDFFFTENFKQAKEFFDDLPSDWELIYLGGNHNSHKKVDPPLKITEKVVKIHYTFAAHAVGINQIMFKTLIEKFLTFSAPLDVMLTDLQKKHNSYCFSPSISKQRPSFSDIQMRNVDYKDWIK